MKRHRRVFLFLVSILLVALFIDIGDAAPGVQDRNPERSVADISYGTRGVSFRPRVRYESIALTVSCPDGTVFQKNFPSGAYPFFDLPGENVDGQYNYEIQITPRATPKTRENQEEAGIEANLEEIRAADLQARKEMIQSGSFLVQGGTIVTSDEVEPDQTVSTDDVLHYDDVIITGSLGVGFDAVDGESFGFDTIRLKEHNLRIHFDDTSYTGSYPRNDWRIYINDSTNGGASFFGLEDTTGGTRPFQIEAGAPSYSLYVEDYGRVGLGTKTPVVELHIKDSDTPTTRLEQDSSGGWTAQTWDIAGNESNFFVRDATNGSKLPFRIQPSTPSSTLCLKSDGKVGIGTWSPAYTVEAETTGENCSLVMERTDGVINYMNATSTFGNFGTVNNFPLRLAVNSTWQLRLDSDGSLTMHSGATCSTGGSWINASSREFKENIVELDADEAQNALNGLNPVKFNYKTDKEEENIGFIAEDVPELLATKDRKGLSPMDVVAVLTKVVQEQQKVVQEQQKTIADLAKRLSDLENNLKSEK